MMGNSSTLTHYKYVLKLPCVIFRDLEFDVINMLVTAAMVLVIRLRLCLEVEWRSMDWNVGFWFWIRLKIPSHSRRI